MAYNDSRLDDSRRSYHSDEESDGGDGHPKCDLTFFAEQVQGLPPAERHRFAQQVHSILLGDTVDHGVGEARQVSYNRRTPPKLRFFSGNKTKGEKEVDFTSWKIYVSSVVDDTTFHDDEKKRVMIDSLSGPALQVAASLPGGATPQELLEILDAYFGDVGDSYDLYAKFRNSIQEMKETASEYLQRIHLLAIRLVDRNGMLRTMVDAEVLRQFENGCADEDLLFRIGVRELFRRPPTVSFLLQRVRTEEQRRAEKKARLKTRGASSQVVTADTSYSAVTSQLSSVQATLQQISSRLEGVMLTPNQKDSGSVATSAVQLESQSGSQAMLNQQSFFQSSNKKRSFNRKTYFCYNCGQDGHFADDCSSDCNPVLVQQKLIASAPKRKSKTGNE